MGISKQLSDNLQRWNVPVHLTPEGLQRLRAKLERLKQSLPHLVSEAARTAAYGDRSENAEYKDAKGRLRRTYRQISSIEDQLKRVVVIAPAASAAGAIQLGSVVVLETGAAGKRETFRILGTHESAPEAGRISHESPLGAALMGRRKNDIVTLKTPRGVREYKIVAIT